MENKPKPRTRKVPNKPKPDDKPDDKPRTKPDDKPKPLDIKKPIQKFPITRAPLYMPLLYVTQEDSKMLWESINRKK